MALLLDLQIKNVMAYFAIRSPFYDRCNRIAAEMKRGLCRIQSEQVCPHACPDKK
jgi:hypothetical protein